MMKKDYELIATVFRRTTPTDGDLSEMAMWGCLCEAMMDALAAENPGFNYDRFRRACNTED